MHTAWQRVMSSSRLLYWKYQKLISGSGGKYCHKSENASFDVCESDVCVVADVLLNLRLTHQPMGHNQNDSTFPMLSSTGPSVIQ